MGNYWSDKNLLERMKAIGFDQDYGNMVVKKLHEELHVNPGAIARAHNKNLSSMDSKSIFSIGCQFTGHLLKVANDLYPKQSFMKHMDVWNKIKVSNVFLPSA